MLDKSNLAPVHNASKKDMDVISSGREFQRICAITDKALSQVATYQISSGARIHHKASLDVLRG